MHHHFQKGRRHTEYECILCFSFNEITPTTMNEVRWKRAYREITNVMPTWSAVLEAAFNYRKSSSEVDMHARLGYVSEVMLHTIDFRKFKFLQTVMAQIPGNSNFYRQLWHLSCGAKVLPTSCSHP